MGGEGMAAVQIGGPTGEAALTNQYKKLQSLWMWQKFNDRNKENKIGEKGNS